MSDDIEIIENELYLHYKQKFKASRIIENIIYPTRFKIESDLWLDMDELPQKDKDYNINLALIKINFWLTQILDNSIIFSKNNSFASKLFLNDGKPITENIMVICPNDPTDDHLAMLLQSKLTSLSKEYVIFGGITVTSDNSRGLSFTFVGNGEEALPGMGDWIGSRSYFSDPWWSRDDASTLDTIPAPDADLTKTPDYAYTLDFLGESFRPSPETTTPKVLKPKFKPTIIKNDD